MVNKIKKGYASFCKFEEVLVGVLLVGMTVLVFGSAIFRFLGKPILWATDMATFAFAWTVFIGGDVVIRNTELNGVEIISNHLPSMVQKALKLLWFILIIGFCLFLTFYGVQLCLSNTARTFSTMSFSYSWCTLSVPVGALLMVISSLVKIKEILKTPASHWERVGKRNNRMEGKK